MRSVPEWIGKTDDEKPPPRVILRVFQRWDGRCHVSGRPIRAGDLWQCDHITAICNGGENRESNLAPILLDKHKEKTAADVAEKSAVYEKRKKFLGIKAKPKSRPLPGTKASGWRKKMDGTVEKR